MVTPQTTDTQLELSPGEAAEKVAEGAQLIDVRQDYEWEAGHIDGAVHIPLEQLPASVDSIDRDRPIVFQCRSGVRSALATQVFRDSGYEAFNLSGGLLAWIESDRGILPAEGVVADPRPDAS
jgi:rhodanese-related sulfurtransferase